MQKLDVWHVVWVLVLVVGVLLLGVTLALVTPLDRLGGRLYHEATREAVP